MNATHGGAFWSFLDQDPRRIPADSSLVTADVLDAWFDPCPAVREFVRSLTGSHCRTSPPMFSEGFEAAVGSAHGIPSRSVVAGPGSSSLIFLGLREWVKPRDPVLILDPTYGEYEHVLGGVIGAGVARHRLNPDDGFRIDLPRLIEEMQAVQPRLTVVVNPNSPTGTEFDAPQIEAVLDALPPEGLLWIDETYIDFTRQRSMESLASRDDRLVVCKSMSKAYALSGLRVAYLVASQSRADAVRRWIPPWFVSGVAQGCGILALEEVGYYRDRWHETASLRACFVDALENLNVGRIWGDCANFVLIELGPDWPAGSILSAEMARAGVFIRDARSMGTGLGDRWIRISVRCELEQERILAELERLGALDSAKAVRA